MGTLSSPVFAIGRARHEQQPQVLSSRWAVLDTNSNLKSCLRDRPCLTRTATKSRLRDRPCLTRTATKSCLRDRPCLTRTATKSCLRDGPRSAYSVHVRINPLFGGATLDVVEDFFYPGRSAC